jgi:hypothetical protein
MIKAGLHLFIITDLSTEQWSANLKVAWIYGILHLEALTSKLSKLKEVQFGPLNFGILVGTVLGTTHT